MIDCIFLFAIIASGFRVPTATRWLSSGSIQLSFSWRLCSGAAASS
jgi:hypothetical protein